MVANKNVGSDEPIECGLQARSHFLFDNGYLNLNHGSFGAIPKAVRDAQRHYQDACERQPDVYIRYVYPGLLLASRERIATYLSAPRSSIVYVPNATTALNTVLHNLRFKPGDVALYFSSIYSGIEKTLLYMSESTPLALHKIPITYPLTPTSLLTAFTTAISTLRSQNLTPTLAIIDTISSLPGTRVPFTSLLSICRSESILSLVDAAHGAGHFPLDVSALRPDFLTSNLHKWLHCPRPCAVLYVAPERQALIRTSLPTSHGFAPRGPGRTRNPLPGTGVELSAFEVLFEFVGTVDSSAFLCVDAALRWRERVTWRELKGEEAVMGYCWDQAGRAAEVVAGLLGTERIVNEEDQKGCCMSNVWLPLRYEELCGEGEVDFDKVVDVARWIEEVLVKEYRTFVAVDFHGQRWSVRLSAQVYLTLEDWEKAAQWFKIVCERAKERKW